MSEIEFHPWNVYSPESPKCLIIGTFPTARHNWSYDFFYPNNSNLFWKIIAEIAGNRLNSFFGDKAIIERKHLLDKLKIAITDMGMQVTRNDNSSLDEKLELIQPMDIYSILDKNPSITKIILTSSTGKVSALKWFELYLNQQGNTYRFKTGKKPLYYSIKYLDREIKIVILYSPSRRAANRISFEGIVEMYRKEISDEGYGS